MTGSLQTDYGAQGTAAARPAVPDAHSSTLSFYFATDTEVLSFYDWNDGAWQDVTAPTAASTTEVLTGTDTAKMVTADALAALWEKGSDEASGATVSLGEGKFFHITGTTTITDIDFDTDKAGREAILTFEGILTLTHNATSLILPTGANITTAAGDCCCVISEGSDNVRVVWYQRKDGTPLAGGGGGGGNTYFGLALTTPPTVGSLTWVNQSTATASNNSTGALFMRKTTTGSRQLSALVETAPSTPYKLTVLMLPALHDSSYQWAGICFRESGTGRLVTIGSVFEGIGGGAAGFVNWSKWTNATTQFGSAQDRKTQCHSGPIWFEIEADGTNIKLRWGMDGENWMDEYSEAKNTFFTTAPDEIGLFVVAEAGTLDAAMTVVSYEKH